jgi:hypothetical protein
VIYDIAGIDALLPGDDGREFWGVMRVEPIYAA